MAALAPDPPTVRTWLVDRLVVVSAETGEESESPAFSTTDVWRTRCRIYPHLSEGKLLKEPPPPVTEKKS